MPQKNLNWVCPPHYCKLESIVDQNENTFNSGICVEDDYHPVRLAYQPPASSTFLSEQTSHQQPASSTFLSEQISTSYQPPAKRTGCMVVEYETLTCFSLQKLTFWYQNIGSLSPLLQWCSYVREKAVGMSSSCQKAHANCHGSESLMNVYRVCTPSDPYQNICRSRLLRATLTIRLIQKVVSNM
jgi:hypothetical protein